MYVIPYIYRIYVICANGYFGVLCVSHVLEHSTIQCCDLFVMHCHISPLGRLDSERSQHAGDSC